MHFLKSKYFYSVAFVGFVYSAIAILLFLQDQALAARLFATEGGLGENIAACSWALGCIFSVTQVSGHKIYHRDLLSWIFISCMFLFTTIRELDLHNVILSPFGIMLRTAWLRDPDVSIFLKIFMIGIAVSFLYFMGYVLFTRRKYLLRNLKQGNVSLALVCLGVLITVVYTAFDGTMLGSKFIYNVIDKPVASMFEEVGETIGAMFCCFSVLPFAFNKNISKE